MPDLVCQMPEEDEIAPEPQTPWNPSAEAAPQEAAPQEPGAEPGEEQPHRASVQGDGLGWSPTNTDGSGAGPYMQAYADDNAMGGGIGIFNGGIGPGETGQIASADARFGHWRDSNGVGTEGLDASAEVSRVSISPGGPLGPVGLDGGVLDASAQLTSSDDEKAIGAGANFIDGAVAVGNNRNQVRIGGGIGVGAAARLHSTLDPSTGKRSYGVGADVGPVSFDAKTDAFSEADLMTAHKTTDP